MSYNKKQYISIATQIANVSLTCDAVFCNARRHYVDKLVVAGAHKHVLEFADGSLLIIDWDNQKLVVA